MEKNNGLEKRRVDVALKILRLERAGKDTEAKELRVQFDRMFSHVRNS